MINNEVTVRYLPFIRNLVRRVTRKLPAHVAFEDMFSAGLVGLVDSMKKFDPKKSDRFETYAEFRIKGAIMDELRATDPLTRDQRSRVSALHEAQQRLANQLGRTPTAEELAAELGCDMDYFHTVVCQSASVRQVRLDDVMSAFDSGTEEPLHLKPDFQAEQRSILLDALSHLPAKQRLVLRLYYFEDMNLKEIGRIMNVTESRICQLHRQAVAALKKSLQDAPASP